ncbi:MAG: hypothetical protein KGH67_04590, partial [Candidatus Micrarchaeota archaeon]|nr:hypothetical protein [Candidatus Micrarchaeota archaeon]
HGENTPMQDQGFVLGPGASETFTFNGTALNPSDFLLALAPGTNYTIEVLGDYGTQIKANVTAK